MAHRAWGCLGALGWAVVSCNGSGSTGGSPDGGSKADGASSIDGAAPSDASPSGDGEAATAPPGDAGASGDDGGVEGAPSDDGGTAGEGGPAGDAGTVSCTGPDAAGLPYTGVVELSRVMMPPAAPRFAGLGQFETADSAPPQGCTGTQMGPCCYETTAPATLMPASAGTITISDGTTTLGTLTSPSYVVSNGSVSSFTWTPGTVLKITSSGGTIDAFTATVVAPGLLAGVTPSLGAALTVSLKSDFVLSWTPGKQACSEIDFGFSQGTGMAHLDCSVADSAGTLTVPAALLGMFTATTGTAVMERIEPRRAITTNAGIGIVAIDVQQTTTTYTP